MRVRIGDKAADPRKPGADAAATANSVVDPSPTVQQRDRPKTENSKESVGNPSCPQATTTESDPAIAPRPHHGEPSSVASPTFLSTVDHVPSAAQLHAKTDTGISGSVAFPTVEKNRDSQLFSLPRWPLEEPCNSEDEHEGRPSPHGFLAHPMEPAVAEEFHRHTSKAHHSNVPTAIPHSLGFSSSIDGDAGKDREHDRYQRGRATERDRSREHDRDTREGDMMGEIAFTEMLRKKRLVILPVRPDGNCMFRALAVHIYDSEDEHFFVRNEVLDFVEEEREWFSMFIAEDFTRYIRRKRRNGCHGNHLELQAAAELYGRPIEVYSYRSEPVNVIDCAARQQNRDFGGGYMQDLEPIRVSFHRGAHYNCVLRLDRALELQRAAAAGINLAKARAPVQEQKSRRLLAAAAASAARRQMELAAATVAAQSSGSRQASVELAISDSATYEALAPTDLADTLATEDEMERAAMALSLVEAREAAMRGGAAGSSSSHLAGSSFNDYTPSSVSALIDMGFKEEDVLEAYLNTDHGSVYDMMRYMSRTVMLSKRSRSPNVSGGASDNMVDPRTCQETEMLHSAAKRIDSLLSENSNHTRAGQPTCDASVDADASIAGRSMETPRPHLHLAPEGCHELDEIYSREEGDDSCSEQLKTDGGDAGPSCK